MSDRRPEISVTIERLEGGAADVRAVEAIAKEALGEGSASLREELERPWSRVWIARDAGFSIAGLLVAWHVADEIHVLDVATKTAVRRRGVASKLLEAALAYARAHAIRILVLEVRRSNAAAIALYRKHGFTILGVRRGYYQNDGEDALEMMLGLDPVTGERVEAKDEIDIDPPHD